MFNSAFGGVSLTSLATEQSAPAAPKGRRKHHSYDEEVDEPPRLIEDEHVEVEQEIPIEENESVESCETTGDLEISVFEE